MKQIPIREAKSHLAALARRVEAGERVVVTRNGRPVFEMVPPQKPGGLDLTALQAWKKEQGYGDVIAVMAPDFDDPLSEDFLITPLP